MVRIQPALLKRRIEAAKEGVDLLTVAQDFLTERNAQLAKKGQRWRGACPICGNGAHSDAFTLDAKEGVFYCHACGEGGDQVRLAELVLSMPCAMAVGWLEHRYDLELPRRPDSWFEKQSRQERVRRGLVEKREGVLRRRLFRIYMIPLLDATGATDEEAKAAWEDFKDLSVAGLVRVSEATEGSRG